MLPPALDDLNKSQFPTNKLCGMLIHASAAASPAVEKQAENIDWPVLLNSLVVLQSLSIKINELTGTIPASIAELDDLTEILMQSNNFRCIARMHSSTPAVCT